MCERGCEREDVCVSVVYLESSASVCVDGRDLVGRLLPGGHQGQHGHTVAHQQRLVPDLGRQASKQARRGG